MATREEMGWEDMNYLRSWRIMRSVLERLISCRIKQVVIALFLSNFITTGCWNDSGLFSEQDIVLGDLEESFPPEDILVFPGMRFHQSMVFYNERALFLTPLDGKLLCDIYDLKDKVLIAELEMPCDDYEVPHANTTCLADSLASHDSVIPIMYISSWNHQRQAFVYDIRTNAGILEPFLVQVIDPKNVNESIIGGGYLDWVVDAKKGFIYSLSYHIKDTSRAIEDNYTHITKFKLPSLDNSYVLLEDSDVIDSFSVPVMPVFQDKFFGDDHIYVVAGADDDSNRFPPRLFEIDVNLKTLYQTPLPFTGEPEGFCYYHGIKWLNMDGWINVYNLDHFMENT